MPSIAPTGPAFLRLRGKAVLFPVLSLRKQDQLAQFLRFNYIEETKRQMDGLENELAKYVIETAKREADKIYPGMIEHGRQLFTFAGLSYALWLSGSGKDASFTAADAGEILDAVPDEAVDVVRRVCGYESLPDGESPKNEPLPVAEIIRLLCNEPYNHSPNEVWEMTLEDIAVIWTAAKKNGQTQSDHLRSVAEFRARRQREQLGMWGQESIWKSASKTSPSRLSA